MSLRTRIRLFAFVILKRIPELSFAERWTWGTKLWERDWAEFGYFLFDFKMVASRALVVRPLVKGDEDSGNETGQKAEMSSRMLVDQLYNLRLGLSAAVDWDTTNTDIV